MVHRSLRDRTCLATFVILAACGGKGASAPAPSKPAPSTAEANDALFALAPARTRSAVVFSGRALELLEATRARAQTLARQDPALADVIAKAENGLADGLGVARGARLAQLGLGGGGGLALFKLSGDRTVSIWPVADREAFVAAFHGTAGADGIDAVEIAHTSLRCRAVQGVYACAADAAVLDQLGTGSLAGKAAAAGGRGDVEVVASGNDDDAARTVDLALTVALDPGQATIRVRIAGVVDDELRRLAGAPVHVDPGRAAGFLAVAIPSLLAQVDVDGPLGDALHAIRGPITAVAPSGIADVDVRVPLSSTAPIRALLTHCDRFPSPPEIRLTADGDRCLATATVPSPSPFTATAWIDGDTLRIDRTGREPAPATGPELTPAGRELAASSWTMVAWGRGVGVTASHRYDLGAFGGSPEGLALRVFGYLAELGLGVRYGDDAFTLTLVVRTALANPAPVADAMPGLIARASGGEDIGAELASLARANPGSPLADDLAAGPAGLPLPSAALGVLSALVIPKFLDYMTVSKKSEAELNLTAIQHAAEAEVVENGRFPIATAPLTPARPCCEGPGHRCPAVESDWAGSPAWDALGFEQTEPSFFQYGYASDGKTLRATAVGDLDCDGNTVTYELQGTLDAAGTPHWTLTRPARAD